MASVTTPPLPLQMATVAAPAGLYKAVREKQEARVRAYPTSDGHVLIIATTLRGTYVGQRHTRLERFTAIGYVMLSDLLQEVLDYERDYESDGPKLVGAG